MNNSNKESLWQQNKKNGQPTRVYFQREYQRWYSPPRCLQVSHDAGTHPLVNPWGSTTIGHYTMVYVAVMTGCAGHHGVVADAGTTTYNRSHTNENLAVQSTVTVAEFIYVDRVTDCVQTTVICSCDCDCRKFRRSIGVD